MMMRSALCACAAAFVALVAGCGGQASRISGKVIRGDISFLVVVDSSDPRLKGEGLPGAQVEVRSTPERGAVLLAGATSDAKGNLTLAVRDGSAILRPAEFSASLDGYVPTSSVMSIPPADKRLLIMLKPGGAGTPK
jgi:hypothetical protein